MNASPSILLGVLAIFVGGACIATQAPINARLGRSMGDPVLAAAISFGVGFAVLAVVAAFRGTLPGLANAGAVPWWAWIGGALGAVYVWAAVWSVGTLGVVTLVAALIAGQMTAALVLDATGAFGVPVHAIDWKRILAVVLVAGGVVLSRL